MSAFVHTPCACGVEIIAVSQDEDDVRIAVASHNELRAHQEWRAVNALKRLPRRGKCICKGGDVTNSPHTPQMGDRSVARPGAPKAAMADGPIVITRVKVELS